jgi:hypothetical protein
MPILVRRLAAEGKAKNGAGQALPPASNMNKLKYDKKLEAEAEKWISSCPGMLEYSQLLRIAARIFSP